MRVTLVHNPKAGSTAAKEADELVSLVGGAGHEVRYQSCKEEGWGEVLEAPADVIAVAGGDGTVARVARKLVDKPVPLAPLPAGTANNLSRALGLVNRPWEEIVRGWAEGRRARLDVAIARGPWGERLLVEGLGAGLFAQAIPEVDADAAAKAMPRADAKVAYTLQILKERLDSCRPVEVRATLDGEDVSGAYIMFEAMIMPFIGPNLFLAPDALPGDGKFQLVMVTREECARMRHYFERWQDEAPRVAVLPTRAGRHLRLDWSGYPLHLDDKLWPKDGRAIEARATVELRIDGGSVQVLLPPGPNGNGNGG